MATTQASSTRKAGVLPIAPTQTNTDAPKQSRARSAAAQDGVKAKIRRLPPGLTEEEFVRILGDIWKAGAGKVGWFSYHPGHIPKSISKDPTPAFAFLQVKEDDLEELSTAVQNATWEDVKGTFNSPSLIGPPYVERSVYKKIPTGKPKKDPKEGTIDQDEEFKAFLASLAVDPTSKPEAEDAPEDSSAEADSKTVMTPLVAALIEKRARKAKEVAEAKSNKHSRQDSHGGKGKSSAASTEEPKKKSKDRIEKSEKSEKPKETVKILKKQAATAAAAEAAKSVANNIKGGASTSEVTSRRAVPKGIHAILKRDLGIEKKDSAKKADVAEKTKDTKESKPSENGASKAAAGVSTTAATETVATPTAPKSQAEKSSRGSRRRGKDSKTADSKPSGSSDIPTTAPPAQPPPPKTPVILQKKKDDSATSSSVKETTNPSKSAVKSAASSVAPAAPTGPKASNSKGNQASGSKKGSNNNAATPSSGSTRAFLKHANQSQGITEHLLRESMEKFGSISSIEIDRRKGFAYVEFADHSGLAKAMASSPVTIASGAVQVLERKDQGPKKASSTTNNVAQAQVPAAKEPITPAAKDNNASAAPSNTAASASTTAEKNSSEQPQQPKRSRRRGRGRGGNGGGGGNSDNKQGDQASSGGGGASASKAPAVEAAGGG